MLLVRQLVLPITFVSLSVGLVHFSNEASAATLGTPVFSAKDWRLEEVISPEAPAGLCIAATTAAIDGVQHHLELVIDRAGLRPNEVRIRPEGDLANVVAFRGALAPRESDKIYQFAKLMVMLPSNPSAPSSVFWNIPRGTDALVAFLKREMRFDVTAVDGGAGKLMAFSLRGSSATIDALETRCNGARPFAASEFERAFLPAIVANADAAKLSTADTDKIRGLLLTAFTALRDSKSTQTDLERLTSLYMNNLNELARVRSNLDRLTQQEVVELNRQRAEAEAAIKKAQDEIAVLRQSVTDQESQLAKANTVYENALNQFKPIQPEHDRLSAELRAGRNALRDSTDRLNSIDSQIQNDQNSLSNLDYELQRVRADLNAAEESARAARRDLTQAENAVRAFDPAAETRRLASMDTRLNDLERMIRDQRMQIERQMREIDQDRITRDQANTRLNMCLRQGQRLVASFAGPGGGEPGGRPGGPGGPPPPGGRPGGPQPGPGEQPGRGPGGQPGGGGPHPGPGPGPGPGPRPNPPSTPVPQPTPAPVPTPAPQPPRPNPAPAPQPPPPPPVNDCRAERQAVADAERRLQASEQVRQQLEQNQRSLIAERDARMNNIANEVARQSQTLVSRQNEARNRVTQADERVGRLQSRARDIIQFDIPRLQNELASLRNERPGVEANVRRAQAQADAARSALSQYDQSVGYDQKKAALDQSINAMEAIKQELARLDREVRRREKIVTNQQAVLADVQARMEAVAQTIQQKQARSAELQKILEPYMRQRDELLAKKAAFDAAFTAAQRDFADLLSR
jgi:hypothetical protein